MFRCMVGVSPVVASHEGISSMRRCSLVVVASPPLRYGEVLAGMLGGDLGWHHAGSIQLGKHVGFWLLYRIEELFTNNINNYIELGKYHSLSIV